MSNNTLLWNSNAKLFGSDNHDWFNVPSLLHLLFGILLYILTIRIFPKINKITIITILNVLHIVEDYLENTTSVSIEGILAEIVNCKNNLFLDYMDHDSLQNFIGDNISFLLGTLIAYKLDNFKIIKRNITLKVIIIIIVMLLLNITIICHLLKKRTKNKL